MPKLIDLTRTLDPRNRDHVHESFKPLEAVLAPTIEYFDPRERGLQRILALFDCTPADLPDQEGWGEDVLTEMSSHCGTHVDAPLHSGRFIEGHPARTISDISLDELFRPAMVLDVREWVQPGEAIPLDGLKAAVKAVGRDIQEGDAVLIRTGQERYTVTDPEFYNYPGMTGETTRFLTGCGATVLGTDALAWDRPFPVMRRAFEETGDSRHIWDGHFAVRDKEAFIVQQLENLAALPLTGFHVGFFPVKLFRTSAAPARVVAFLPD